MKSRFLENLLFALRNVFRQRARAIANLLAIGLGVAGLIIVGGFVQDIFIQLGEAIIHGQTGHIQVTRQGFQNGGLRSPDKYLIENPEKIRSQLLEFPGVSSVLSRINFTGTLNNGKRDLGVIGEGVEADFESALTGIYVRYISGRALSDKDKFGMVVGQGVAKSLNVEPGDRIALVVSLAEGAINTLDFEIVGVFQTFSKDFDARAVRITLPAARELMATEAVHKLVMVLNQTSESGLVAEKVRKKLGGNGSEVTLWHDLSDFYSKTIDLYDRQFGVLRLIILMMVLLSVANTINMTLFERTREFGTVMAIGGRPSSIFNQIMTEGVLVGGCGAILGMLLGVSAAWGISAIGIPMPPPPNANLGYTAYIRVDPPSVLLAGLIGWLATVLASILPAHRASRLSIVDALRHGL
ncbi:ABC transporter permease [Dechloromonas sp. XY25]|uniref:ABC transporter permease n=1 Tax=Dechloromonas hankyongensis TaxID=2908002 RepID=A0ABS9K3L1_9RHOO|nr:FtsX-like permease family protein [Dechloromonas hankyongensis]MCG2577733.1 ABC transporter permease [Dechloromonas hankyongensis]